MKQTTELNEQINSLMTHIYKSIQDIDQASTLLADIKDNNLSLETDELQKFKDAIDAKTKFIQDIDIQIQKNLTKVSSEIIKFYNESIARHDKALNELRDYVGFFDSHTS